jgi:MFS family permease
VIAQIASGSIFGAFTFKLIYLLSAGVMAVFFLLASTTLKNIPDPTYDTLNGTKYIKEFFKNKNLRRAYVLSFLLQLFFALMVIYTPIYLSLHLGFSWSEIGIIFSIMLLPFVLVPFRAGVYADKIGERKMLVFGFMLAALATLTLFFIHAHNIFIWAFALFMTRVGASTIEVMSDAYFFKHIKTENEEYVGVYRSASPVAYVVGPLLASVIFIFVPTFNYIYIVLAALMLYGAYLSSTIRRSDI